MLLVGPERDQMSDEIFRYRLYQTREHGESDKKYGTGTRVINEQHTNNPSLFGLVERVMHVHGIYM